MLERFMEVEYKFAVAGVADTLESFWLLRHDGDLKTNIHF